MLQLNHKLDSHKNTVHCGLDKCQKAIALSADPWSDKLKHLAAG